MPLTRLEHYLVLTDDIEKTKDFYCDVLGMKQGFRPELEFPGYWLYVEDAVWTRKVGIPISARAPATGPVDHIAFNATGFDEIRSRIKQRDVPFSENSLPEISMRQIFTRDPNGVPIEINFRN